MLHCGACGERFDKSKDLVKHLTGPCPALAMLRAYNSILISGDPSHRKSRLFQAVHNNKHLINRYASAIALEMGSSERAKIHSKLCEALGLSYLHFKPFEADNIDEVPSFDDCRKILYDALASEITNI